MKRLLNRIRYKIQIPVFILCLTTCDNSHDQKRSLLYLQPSTDSTINLKNRKADDLSYPLYIEPQPYLWPFSPDKDEFSDESLLDLSALNSQINGPEFRITLSEDKNSFTLLDGTPIRFWPVNIDVGKETKKELEEKVRFLSKRGVNMVRLHTSLNPKTPESNINKINTDALDTIFRLVAALKKEGVYLTLSPYWGPAITRNGWNKSIDDNWPVPRNPDAKSAAGLLFFDPILQTAYKSWLSTLLNTTNPYTGIALKDDPTLAIFQIQNEDSLLFWTFDNLAGEDLDLLRAKYATWLKNQYGSLAAVKARWQEAPPKGSSVDDNWEKELISFAQLWHMSRINLDSEEGFKLRLDDQTQFLLETMKSFNHQIVTFLRDEISTDVLINPGNWKTASAELLGDLERYSYTDGDVMALNRYVSSDHKGDNSGWAITNGQTYTDASVLLDPMALPIAVKQPSGYPFIITESNWVAPLSFQAEGPFLISIMQAINGVDGYYWFTAGAQQWQQPASSNGYLPSLGKWTIQGPMTFGQFPAAAFSYRQGLVSFAGEAFNEIRTIKSMVQRTKPEIYERQGFDINRDQRRSLNKEANTALSFFQGSVTVNYTEDDIAKPATKYTIDDFSSIRNDTNYTKTSNQMFWDSQAGIAVIDAPASQGACGFMFGAELQTSHVQFKIDNPYACIWLVALDEKPLDKSEKVLVQMGTRQFSDGWQTNPISWKENNASISGREITNHGQAPWNIEEINGLLVLKNETLQFIKVLDANGMETSSRDVVTIDGEIALRLPKRSLYMLLVK